MCSPYHCNAKKNNKKNAGMTTATYRCVGGWWGENLRKAFVFWKCSSREAPSAALCCVSTRRLCRSLCAGVRGAETAEKGLQKC